MSDEPRTFRTGEHGAHRARGPTRAIGAGARATPVDGADGAALLVELPEGLLTTERAASEKRARDAVHVIAATETIRLVDGTGGDTAYRGALYGDGTRPAALFPLLEGATLGSALARARAGEAFPPALVATLAYECAHGLARTEDVDVLGPSSIVIATDGRARVRGPLLEALAGTLRDATGSLAYVAPERIQRDAGSITGARAFALGAMLFELVAGRALFASTGAAVRQLATWNVTMEELRALPESVPSELRAALWTLLQRDPSRRASPAKLCELLAPLHAPSPALAAVFAPAPVEAPYFAP